MEGQKHQDGQAGDGEGAASERAEGRARVARVLIGPLEQMGLRKRRGQTSAGLAQMLARLRRRLWYMSERELLALREAVLRLDHGGLWPPEALVIGTARQIVPEPERFSPSVRRWMRSAAGRRALEESEVLAVALLQQLVRVGPVRSEDMMLAVRRSAAGIEDTLAAARREIQCGTPLADQARRTLEAYGERVQLVRQMVLGPEEPEDDDEFACDLAGEEVP